MSQVPKGGAYIILVRITMPLDRASEPAEYEPSDLAGLLNPQGQLSGGYKTFSFFKWGSSLQLGIACDPAASDETVASINEILSSWRFDPIPSGNPGWAFNVAIKLIPDKGHPETMPRSGEQSRGLIAQSTSYTVNSSKTVHFHFTFKWNISTAETNISKPQHWWGISMSCRTVPPNSFVKAGRLFHRSRKFAARYSVEYLWYYEYVANCCKGLETMIYREVRETIKVLP